MCSAEDETVRKQLLLFENDVDFFFVEKFEKIRSRDASLRLRTSRA